MDERADRLGTWAGTAAAVVVALPVILGDDRGMNGPAALWWVAYIVFVLAFISDDASFGIPGTQRLPQWAKFAALVLSANVAYLIFPWGVTAVLMVIAAISGAYELPARWTRNLIAAQCGVIWVWMQIASDEVAEALTSTVVFGAFQAFAVLMVYSRRSEVAAREKLAAVNVELEASSAVLAESSRASERVRIARELHDLVGHQLTALSLELEVASHKVDGEAREHVVRARDTARDLLNDVRKAVGELRARMPGLERPLRELVADVPQLDVKLDVSEEIELDEQTALTVVRCVQEVVTNTLKHAHAKHLWVSVHAAEDGVVVDARDDGRGAAAISPGHGLTGMRERVEQRGGELLVHSADNQGFRVEARVPVA